MVGADSIADETSGAPYYRVHIRIAPEELAALPNVKTLPGMPAQAMIETGRQTLADYLLSPVLRSMSNALREGNGLTDLRPVRMALWPLVRTGSHINGNPGGETPVSQPRPADLSLPGGFFTGAK